MTGKVIALAIVAFISMQATIVKELPVQVGPKKFFVTVDLFGNTISSGFFLGAAQGGAKDFAVSSVFTDTDFQTDAKILQTNPLTPEKVFLNPVPEGSEKVNNPLFNSVITKVALLGSSPVVVKPGGPYPLVALISGNTLRTNQVAINDALGYQASAIESLAAFGSEIFAAVAPKNGTFGSEGSGIALLNSGTVLGTVNAQTGDNNGNLAAKLNINADALIGIEQNALLQNCVDMSWDSILSRLYVVLKVGRSNSALQGGAISTLVGKVDAKKLILAPVVPLNANSFAQNSDDHIIGFFHTGDGTEIFSSIYKIRTLHSSTGFSYIIVNGGVTQGDAKNKIYALPVVKPKTTVKKGDNGDVTEVTNINDVGKISAKNDFSRPAQMASELITAQDVCAIVGAGPLPTTQDHDISDIFVASDAVFVSLSGTRDIAHETGIFYSQALFNAQGKIMSWTPWQRVMGSVDESFASGVMTQDGKFLYITGNSDIAKCTEWGEGNGDGLLGGPQANPSLGLIKTLDAEFNCENGGVAQLFFFDEFTPTFKSAEMQGNLSLMIATGLGRIALFQTGAHDGQNFTPTIGNVKASFARGLNGFMPNASGKNLVFIENGVLDEICAISCAEISRGVAGWIFVGGSGGIAVLSDVSGNGWNAALGLGAEFDGLGDSFSFKKVGNFKNVLSLACDNQFLYVLERNAISKITLDSSNFSGSAVTEMLVSPNTVTGCQGAFLDFVIVQGTAIVGTTHGLFTIDLATLKIRKIESVTGPVPHLNFISSTKGINSYGNLYIINVDVNMPVAVVRRFSFNSLGLQEISGAAKTFLMLGKYRAGVASDGATFFHTSPKNFSEADFLDSLAVKGDLVQFGIRGTPVDLALGEDFNFKYAGFLKRNTASGAWMIPGDFGIRVNE